MAREMKANQIIRLTTQIEHFSKALTKPDTLTFNTVHSTLLKSRLSNTRPRLSKHIMQFEKKKLP